MSVSFIGSDALYGPSALTPVVGSGALGLDTSSTPAPSSAAAPSAAPAQSNPYQQAYDSLATWSDNYLLQAAECGAPQIPQFTAGGTASSFAQLTTLLGQIAPAVQQGLYGNGGSSINTLA